MGSIDSFLCILGVEFGTGADQLSGGWVMDLEGLARGGLDPFAVDIADTGLEEGWIPELEARMKVLSRFSSCEENSATKHTLGTMVEERR